MKKHIIPFLLILLSLTYSGASAQVTTQGTDFYVAFGFNSGGTSDNMQIRIATTLATTVTFTFAESATTYSFTVPAESVFTRQLTSTEVNSVYSVTTGSSYKSLRIQSTVPVSAYALNQHSATTDATNLLPVTNYGTDYYLLSYQVISSRSDGYKVIATQNGTTVYENNEATPRATLQAGQVYTAYYPNADITGTRITTNHPVAFFSTNGGTNVPINTDFADILFQQMAPVNSWGNTFVVPVSHRGKERVRVLASQNGTIVTQTGGTKKTDGGGGAQNPPNENSFTLNAGQYAEFEIELTTGGMYISADKPVAVASYLMGTGYAGGLTVPKGDPAMTWIPAVEQMIEGTAIAPFAPTGSTNLNEHHALVVTPTDTRDQTTVSIGGAPATPLTGGWITVNGAGNLYSFYSMQLTNTTASYYFYNPSKLTVMGYGLGSAESYYYISGASGRSLNPSFYINDIHYQDLDGNAICGQTNFHIRGVTQLQLSAAPGHIKWYVDGTEVVSARDLLEWDINTLTIGTTHTFRMEVLEVIDEYNHTYLHTLSTTFTLKNQAVAATITTTGTTVCSGATATLAGSSIAGITNPVYRWYNSQTTLIPLHTGAIYTTPALTATTTYYVSVEGDNYCENAMNDRKPVTVTVSGSLTPGSIGTAQSICYNTVPQPLTEINAPGCGCGSYDYQWQSSTNGTNWSNISDAKAVSYSPPALTASAYYRRAVTSGSCGTVYSASVLITVNPVVTVNAVSDTTVCAGTVVPQKTFSSPTAGVTYTWTNNNTAIGLAASGTGNQPQFTAAQVTQAVTATITVTPVYNGCAGTSRTYTITVNSCTVPVNPHIRSRVDN
jgi:hypothetical protein